MNIRQRLERLELIQPVKPMSVVRIIQRPGQDISEQLAAAERAGHSVITRRIIAAPDYAETKA